METLHEREVRNIPTPISIEAHHQTKLFHVLTRTVNERLTKKQKAILLFLSRKENIGKTLYKVVSELSRELPCSKSALYNNINSLKRCGLVTNNHGRPLKLTKVAELILKSGIGSWC